MKFSPQSRVWIYQSDRPFTAIEKSEIVNKLSDFVQEWAAHGTALQTKFEMPYDHFIVLVVDENQAQASGCSIDSSVRIIKQIEQTYGVDLFNRFNMAYKLGEEVKVINKEDFETLISIQKINAETIVFNNMVQNYEAYQTQWEVPLSKSWHAHIFAEHLILAKK
ncbi:MAG: ABC transporter ATPase [Pedobacter sp.]|nr:MAG: ABC transporter ATPase [Pedobacter sp.]